MTAAPAQTTALSNAVNDFRSMLERVKPSMSAVLPKHLTADRLCKVAMVAAAKNPLLYKCNLNSVAQSVMTAAQLGLDCGGALGSAYLVPYRNKSNGYDCQLIIGYRGMIDLARRSGQIESIVARPVFAGDQFEIGYGLDDKLTHRPDTSAEPTPERLIGVYVVAKFVGGGHHIEYMGRAEIEQVRRRSRAGNNGPWVTDYIEMCKKTVIRRAFKFLPMSIETISRMLDASDSQGSAGAAAVADIIDGVATEMPEDAPATSEPETEQPEQQQQHEDPDDPAPDPAAEDSKVSTVAAKLRQRQQQARQ